MILRNIKKLCVRLPYVNIIILTQVVMLNSLKRKIGYIEKPYKWDFKFQPPLFSKKIPCVHGYKFHFKLTTHWRISMQSHLKHGLPQEPITKKSWTCGSNIEVLYFLFCFLGSNHPLFQVITTNLLTLLGRSSFLQFFLFTHCVFLDMPIESNPWS